MKSENGKSLFPKMTQLLSIVASPWKVPWWPHPCRGGQPLRLNFDCWDLNSWSAGVGAGDESSPTSSQQIIGWNVKPTWTLNSCSEKLWYIMFQHYCSQPKVGRHIVQPNCPDWWPFCTSKKSGGGQTSKSTQHGRSPLILTSDHKLYLPPTKHFKILNNWHKFDSSIFR